MNKVRLGILVAILGLAVVALSQRSALQAWASGVERRAARLVGKPAPELPRGLETLDGAPVNLAGLKGKVVLVHFWTFGCGNCRNMLPHFARWAQRSGVVVVGVHTPEFDWEKKKDKLRQFVKEQKIGWTVVIDDEMAAWDRFQVDAWPTIFVIDKNGVVQKVTVGDDAGPAVDDVIGKLLSI